MDAVSLGTVEARERGGSEESARRATLTAAAQARSFRSNEYRKNVLEAQIRNLQPRGTCAPPPA